MFPQPRVKKKIEHKRGGMKDVLRLHRCKIFLSSRRSISASEFDSAFQISRITFKPALAELYDQMHLPLGFGMASTAGLIGDPINLHAAAATPWSHVLSAGAASPIDPSKQAGRQACRSFHPGIAFLHLPP
jgi:hypothetical protein